MRRPAAVTALHSIAVLLLVVGILGAVGIVVYAVMNGPWTSNESLIIILSAVGSIFYGAIAWAFLATVAHIADILLDIRDQR